MKQLMLKKVKLWNGCKLWISFPQKRWLSLVLKYRSISVKLTDFGTEAESSVSNGIIEGKCCIEMGFYTCFYKCT